MTGIDGGIDEDVLGLDADLVSSPPRGSVAVWGFPPHGWAIPTLTLLAEVCEALTRAEEPPTIPDIRGVAAEVARRLQRSAEANEIALAGWPALLIGPVRRAVTLTALVGADYERAIMLLQACLEMPLGRPARARAHHDLARVSPAKPTA